MKVKNSMWTKIIVAMCMVLCGFLLISKQKAFAATQLEVASVEYYNQNVVVFNNSNTKLFIATETEAARGSWDVMEVDDGDYTSIDFSWLSETSDNVLFIKGDVDETPARIVLKKKPIKFDLTINCSNMGSLSGDSNIASLVNIMTTEGTGEEPVDFYDLEWKKDDSGQWNSSTTLTVRMLEKFQARGTYLYFRIRAVDDTVTVNNGAVDINEDRVNHGYQGGIIEYIAKDNTLTLGDDFPNGSKGRRFSSELKFKVAEKSPSMVTKVDGEKFKAQIKYGNEYRVTMNGKTTDWIKVTDKSIKSIPLKEIANNPAFADTIPAGVIYDGITMGFPGMFIEVRDYATEKKAASKITEIDLEAQHKLTSNIKEEATPLDAIEKGNPDIYVSYNGNKNVVITIPKATTTLPYEYCIVKKDSKLDIERASWTSITKGTGVRILASKAPDDSTIYIRQEEIKSKAATKTSEAIGYKLASTVVTYKVSYPSVPDAINDSLVYTKGYPTELKIVINLNASGKDPFETEVKNIKLGTKEIGFVPTASVSPDDSTIKILTLKLNDEDLKSMANCSKRAVTITYMNGTVDKTSIKITIKNPTSAELLNVADAKGTLAGSINITMNSTKGTNNSFVYVIGDKAVTEVYSEMTLPNDSTVKDFVSMTDIVVPATGFITIYEINPDRNIVRFKCIEITTKNRS